MFVWPLGKIKTPSKTATNRDQVLIKIGQLSKAPLLSHDALTNIKGFIRLTRYRARYKNLGTTQRQEVYTKVRARIEQIAALSC